MASCNLILLFYYLSKYNITVCFILGSPYEHLHVLSGSLEFHFFKPGCLCQKYTEIKS